MDSQETSLAAAASIRPSAATLRSEINALIRKLGPKGMTCDEVEVLTGISHQSASARINELMKSDSIQDSGERRHTRSGRKAIVWTSL
jgi:predicted transcriptional regulator